MKVLIIDKDGVLNPEVFISAVRWGLFNVSPIIMLRLLLGYIFLKRIKDSDMLHLEKFFEKNKQFSHPSSGIVNSMIILRKKYDRIVMLTNNGVGEAANERILNEIKNYYPSGMFDEVIVQAVGQIKEHVYKKWYDEGHNVTVIDDSNRHTKAALRLGIQSVIKIGKRHSHDRAFETLSSYVETL